MRVLMIATSFPKYPGEMTAPFIEEIAAAIAARGHEVHMVLPTHPELQRQPVERGIHIHAYQYAPLKQLHVWGYASALHNDVALRPSALAVAPWALGASALAMQRLVAQRAFDVIHAHWVIPNGLPAWLVAQKTHTPLILSTHGSDVSVTERTAAAALLVCGLSQAARAITAPSKDLTTRMAALGAPIERLHVLPYCVHADEFHPDVRAGAAFRAQHNIADDTPLLFAVGRMVEKKGFIYLIKALAQLRASIPDVRLMIAGYGPLRTELEQAAAQHQLQDHVIFPGAIHREQINAAFNAATVFVLPSVRDRSGNVDGLPNTLIEAMGAGRPIVASLIAGVPAVIESGTHGLLVAPGNIDALAHALQQLLQQPSLAAQLGAQARARVENELTWNRYAARLEHLYTKDHQ